MATLAQGNLDYYDCRTCGSTLVREQKRDRPQHALGIALTWAPAEVETLAVRLSTPLARPTAWAGLSERTLGQFSICLVATT
jgi:hypothetical protein